MEETVKRVELEWIELIMMAKQIGLTIEEVREFLRKETSRPRLTEQ